jgi:heme-degrading monooxygenase HmoA
MWTRYVGGGRVEVVTVSWWESYTSIKAFTGADISRAVFYPRDDDFLLDRETTVTHYEVAAGT